MQDPLNFDRWQVLQGDCLEPLRSLPDGCIDAVVTDPPYGLGKEPDALAMLRDWLKDGYHEVKGSGFMGKAWDAFVPQPVVWKEVLRVLKPGAHLLCFAGTRTYDLMVLGLRIAGFEIRDQLAWMYGSGFPKSHNLGGEWEGWGSALKPAWEPVVLARKPLEGTIAQNVEAHGTGALNINGCRIEGRYKCDGGTPGFTQGKGWNPNSMVRLGERETAGRWPANICHDGSEEVEAAFARFGEGMSTFPGSFQRIKTSKGKPGGEYGNQEHKSLREPTALAKPGYGDSGTASRFFFCGKASKADRDEGLEAFEKQQAGVKNSSGRGYSESDPHREILRSNPHPTVKPTDLMRWLCRLITPPGGLVLDPFTGSGSTGKAAMLEGFRFLGMELDPAYCDIARARIQAAAAQPRLDFDAPEQEQAPKPKQMGLWEELA